MSSRLFFLEKFLKISRIKLELLHGDLLLMASSSDKKTGSRMRMLLVEDEKKIDVPILMLTAKDKVGDKVLGLDAGADDYLTKPFAFEEFLARVRALLRRERRDKTTTLKAADLELDQITHKVKRAGKEITLTGKEYALLEYLMLNANQVVTRTMISEHIWNEDFDSFTNVIDVYINYLRNKIDQGFKKQLIHTLRGKGYILKE